MSIIQKIAARQSAGVLKPMIQDKAAQPLVRKAGPINAAQRAAFLNQLGGASDTFRNRLGNQVTQYMAGKGWNRPNKKGAISY